MVAHSPAVPGIFTCMTTFSDPLWGYQLTYPDDWVHQRTGDIEAFAATEAALSTDYTDPQAGYLLARCEFNHTGESIDPLWNDHIAKLSLMLGAKNVGSVPLAMGGGTGFEAEIVLPKKRNKRLWTGILSYNLTILHLMVAHPLDNRNWFEPQGTQIITSLRFLSQVSDLAVINGDFPLPPNYISIDPAAILRDINSNQHWQAFTGQSTIDALQAFYLRELPRYDWEIIEFTPYPNQAGINFARLHISKETQTAALGLVPVDRDENTGAIVIKYE